MSQNNKSEPQKETVKAAETVTIINKTKGLRRLLTKPILPDDVGVVFTKDEYELLKKGKAFQAQVKDGEFVIK